MVRYVRRAWADTEQTVIKMDVFQYKSLVLVPLNSMFRISNSGRDYMCLLYMF